MATKAEVTTAEAMMVVVTLAAEMAVVETEEAIDMRVAQLRVNCEHPRRFAPADVLRLEIKSTMKIGVISAAVILFLTACDRTDLRPSDAELRQRLTGTWNIELRGPDGSSDSNFQGTFIFAADGSYRSEIVTTVSNEMRSVTLRGFARVQDGFLVGTLTNALPQWLPEGKRGRLPPGGVTSRTKIVRLDEQWLVFETNQFGSVVYTRVR